MRFKVGSKVVNINSPGPGIVEGGIYRVRGYCHSGNLYLDNLDGTPTKTGGCGNFWCRDENNFELITSNKVKMRDNKVK